MRNVFMAIGKKIEFTLHCVSVSCLIVLGLVLTAVVFVRWFPIAQISWSDEVVEWAFAWMVFFGAAALWCNHEHFYVDFFESKLKLYRVGVYHLLMIEVLAIIFLILFIYYSILFTSKADATSPILHLPKNLWYICMPISGVIMASYSLGNIANLVIKIGQSLHVASEQT